MTEGKASQRRGKDVGPRPGGLRAHQDPFELPSKAPWRTLDMEWCFAHCGCQQGSMSRTLSISGELSWAPGLQPRSSELTTGLVGMAASEPPRPRGVGPWQQHSASRPWVLQAFLQLLAGLPSSDLRLRGWVEMEEGSGRVGGWAGS